MTSRTDNCQSKWNYLFSARRQTLTCQRSVGETVLTECSLSFSQTYSTSESAGPAEEPKGQVIQV